MRGQGDENIRATDARQQVKPAGRTAGFRALTNRVSGGHGELEIAAGRVAGQIRMRAGVQAGRQARGQAGRQAFRQVLCMRHKPSNAPLQTHVATMSQMPVASLKQGGRQGRR